MTVETFMFIESVLNEIEKIRGANTPDEEETLGAVFDKGYFMACDEIQKRIEQIAEYVK